MAVICQNWPGMIGFFSELSHDAIQGHSAIAHPYCLVKICSAGIPDVSK